MQSLGFIHDMMDVTVLFLYVTARSNYPLTTQEVYELCFQDDCLSYFDVCTALPQMVQSGHLSMTEDEKYVITDKGREHGELTQDSIAYTVKQKAENAVARFNRQIRRSSFIKTQVTHREDGECSVLLSLDDGTSNLMTLELVAPNERQAVRLGKMFNLKAEEIYNLVMAALLDAEEMLDS